MIESPSFPLLFPLGKACKSLIPLKRSSSPGAALDSWPKKSILKQIIFWTGIPDFFKDPQMKMEWTELKSLPVLFWKWLFDDEKRSHQRTGCRFLVRYFGEGLQHGHKLTNLMDVSESGVQFSSKHKFKKKSVLQLTINFPEMRRDINVMARVVWTRGLVSKHHSNSGHRIGATFINILPEDRQVLSRYVNKAHLTTASI
jgi:hypothetical protein